MSQQADGPSEPQPSPPPRGPCHGRRHRRPSVLRLSPLALLAVLRGSQVAPAAAFHPQQRQRRWAAGAGAGAGAGIGAGSSISISRALSRRSFREGSDVSVDVEMERQQREHEYTYGQGDAYPQHAHPQHHAQHAHPQHHAQHHQPRVEERQWESRGGGGPSFAGLESHGAAAADAHAHAMLPPWLQNPAPSAGGAADADASLNRLKEAMTSTYLSPTEASAIVSAIITAAAGSYRRVAGAAEFCRILVETVEMGASSLAAGAFHYCTCVTAQERAALSRASSDSSLFSLSEFWDVHDGRPGAAGSGSGSGSSSSACIAALEASCGPHAAQIARDAARLKKTEGVAAHTRAHTNHGDYDDAYVNIQNLLLSETRDWRALAIRSAASLYRLRGLLAARSADPDGSTQLSPEVVRETRDALRIYAPLAGRLGMHRLKNELEGAAFRLRYRRQYERVVALGLERRDLHLHSIDGPVPSHVSVGEGMARVLRQFATDLKEVLDRDATFSPDATDVVVSARVKEPYSLWRKILRAGRSHKILDIPDALAVRVVLNARKQDPDEPDDITAARERAMCYYVQELCMARWPANAATGGRFKDYIGQPKPNGYQTLHYTARTHWGGVDWPLEVQVRSGEMHRVAEYGLAAHWDYKERTGRGAGASAAGPASALDQNYLEAVQEWHWQQKEGEVQQDITASSREGERDHRGHRCGLGDDGAASSPYIQALSVAQADLARDQVFVVLAPEGSDQAGTVVSLPSGSCVIDALREGARRFEVDGQCFQGKAHPGVTHNGLPVPTVTQKLNNGDVVTLPLVVGAERTNAAPVAAVLTP